MLDFWLQDSQLLEPHMNLVDQCVQGEGLVQIICEIKDEENLKKINIVDVLKPPEEEPQRYRKVYKYSFFIKVKTHF